MPCIQPITPASRRRLVALKERGIISQVKLSFILRYASSRVFWVFAKPIRYYYQFLTGYQRRGVKVAVFNKGRVLLVRPNYAHRLWTMPGGGVERTETYEETGVREVHEETGVVIGNLRFIREYDTLDGSIKGHTKVFGAYSQSDRIVADGIEIKEVGWFPLDALPHDRVPRIDATLEAYRERIEATPRCA